MKKLILTMMIGAAILTACEQTTNNNMATLSVHLTDAPADYEEVLIDIQKVLIHTDVEGEDDWTEMENSNIGVYNLLDFTNGLDTLLAEHEMPAATISQMRLVLGDKNQIKYRGLYYDLNTPSAQQSGLKFNIHAELTEGVTYHLWIDFDAGRSIVQKGNGSYSLKPVIRTYTEASSGAINGIIHPANERAYVTAISGNQDTLATFSDTVNGHFLIRGVDAGSYTLRVTPGSAYQTQTIDDINVVLGESYAVDTIYLEASK